MSETEADAIARLATAGMPHQPAIAFEGFAALPLPPGWEVQTIDYAKRLPAPARPAGDIVVHDAASFLAALEQRDVGSTVVYADEERLALVAVLNDDVPAGPGWRDYRVLLALRPTKEWADWKTNNERGFEQEAFAHFVQRHIRDFHQPSAADMLELASSIEGTKNASFKQGNRLQDGSRQFHWNETVEARAGRAGQIEIPEKFAVLARPFIGSEPWEVEAWFRFRIREGHLVVSYELDRPDLIEKALFDELVNDVADNTPATIIRGPAPTARP